MPDDVSFVEVLGLTEVLGENGSRVPTSASGDEPLEILSLLGTGGMLGLIFIEPDGRLHLTNLGIEFLRAEFPEKLRILRTQLSSIEPFKAALELLSNKGSVSSSEIASKLSENQIWGKIGEDCVRQVLIEWGPSTGLLRSIGGDYFQLNL